MLSNFCLLFHVFTSAATESVCEVSWEIQLLVFLIYNSFKDFISPLSLLTSASAQIVVLAGVSAKKVFNRANEIVPPCRENNLQSVSYMTSYSLNFYLPNKFACRCFGTLKTFCFY